MVGGILLFLSAAGTRWTVIAATRLLSSKERIQLIESAVQDLAPNRYPSKEDPKRGVSIVIRDTEGRPIPFALGAFEIENVGSCTARDARADANGVVTNLLEPGIFYFMAWTPDFPPKFIGPIQTSDTNALRDLEIILDKGFDFRMVARDQRTGQPISGAKAITFVKCPPNSDCWLQLNQTEWKTDESGQLVITNVGTLPLRLLLDERGYELTSVFANPKDQGQMFSYNAIPAIPFHGVVLDATGKAVAGAKVHVLHATPFSDFPVDRLNSLHAPIAITDQSGRFEITQFPQDQKFCLLVDGPAHAVEVEEKVMAGQERVIRLRPAKTWEGKINLQVDQQVLGMNSMKVIGSVKLDDYYEGYSFPVAFQMTDISNGAGSPSKVATFRFTNRFEGDWSLVAGSQKFTEHELSKHVLLELKPDEQKGVVNEKLREVVFRFQHPSGVTPTGSMAVIVPETKPGNATRKMIHIQNGEARCQLPVGITISYETGETIGFCFPAVHDIQIEDLLIPKVITIPVIPAGAIYATTLAADGMPASRVSMSVVEVERSALVKDIAGITIGSSISRGPSKTYFSGPLPLYGRYRVVSQQENNFAISDEIYLTEANPDRRVELKLALGIRLQGQVLDLAGNGIHGAEVSLWMSLGNHSFGGEKCVTDVLGNFSFSVLNSQLSNYKVEVTADGFAKTNQIVQLSNQPMKLTLSPGFRLAGRVLNEVSGNPVAGKTISALRPSGGGSDFVRTDSQGVFEFSSLPAGVYRLEVFDTPRSEAVYSAGQTNILILVKSSNK